MRILTRKGYIKSAAMLFELTESQLERVSLNRDFFKDSTFILEILEAKGENAHFFSIDSGGIPLDLKPYIRKVLRDYKSVSWWDREMNDFMIIRR